MSRLLVCFEADAADEEDESLFFELKADSLKLELFKGDMEEGLLDNEVKGAVDAIPIPVLVETILPALLRRRSLDTPLLLLLLFTACFSHIATSLLLSSTSR